MIGFQFYEIKNSTDLYKYIDAKSNEYIKTKYLTNNESDFNLLKTYWASKEISKINSSENLVKKIWTSRKLNLPTLFHINQYEEIANLSLEEYQIFFQDFSIFLTELKPYWIFSADTPR